jgi:DNA polymerase-3 subunit alpha
VQIASKRPDDKVTVVGVVASLREKMNKEKGTRFGFFTLEDLTGTVEVLCWASRPGQGNRPAQKGWADWEHVVKRDEPIVVHGQIRMNTRDEENPSAEITATDIQLLSDVRSQKTSLLTLRIDAEELSADKAGELKALVARHSGPCAAVVRAVIPRETETVVRLPSKVGTADEFIDAVRRLGFEVELS